MIQIYEIVLFLNVYIELIQNFINKVKFKQENQLYSSICIVLGIKKVSSNNRQNKFHY